LAGLNIMVVKVAIPTPGEERAWSRVMGKLVAAGKPAEEVVIKGVPWLPTMTHTVEAAAMDLESSTGPMIATVSGQEMMALARPLVHFCKPGICLTGMVKPALVTVTP